MHTYKRGGPWAEDLKEAGISQLFTFGDLPDEFKDIQKLHQARVNGYIKKERKIPTTGAPVILWRNCI